MADSPGVFTSGSVHLLDRLISYWKLDEASGSRADANGQNDPLTDNNTTGSAAGIINNGAKFIAANLNYLSIPSNTSLQMYGNTNFTISAWIKLSSQPSVSGAYTIVGKDTNTPASSRDYTMDYDGGGTGFRFYIQGGGTYIVGTGASLSLGVFYFVVGWYDSSNGQVHIRLNDTTTQNSANTGATGADVSAAQFSLGRKSYAGFEGYADAIIDEVGIWKRLLTSAEITALYNAGAALPYSSFTT